MFDCDMAATGERKGRQQIIVSLNNKCLVS